MDQLPHQVVTLADDAVHIVEGLGKSPLFAAEAAAGKVELKHVADKLLQTTAASEAKTILLEVGKTYDALTPDEKVKAEVTLRVTLSALGINLTDAQIQSAFTDVGKPGKRFRRTPCSRQHSPSLHL